MVQSTPNRAVTVCDVTGLISNSARPPLGAQRSAGLIIYSMSTTTGRSLTLIRVCISCNDSFILGSVYVMVLADEARLTPCFIAVMGLIFVCVAFSARLPC